MMCESHMGRITAPRSQGGAKVRTRGLLKSWLMSVSCDFWKAHPKYPSRQSTSNNAWQGCTCPFVKWPQNGRWCRRRCRRWTCYCTFHQGWYLDMCVAVGTISQLIVTISQLRVTNMFKIMLPTSSNDVHSTNVDDFGLYKFRCWIYKFRFEPIWLHRLSGIAWSWYRSWVIQESDTDSGEESDTDSGEESDTDSVDRLDVLLASMRMEPPPNLGNDFGHRAANRSFAFDSGWSCWEVLSRSTRPAWCCASQSCLAWGGLVIK